MLTGSADPQVLAHAAAAIENFASQPESLSGVETMQIAWEIERAGTDALLPPGLHPTLPPLVTWLVQRVAESSWGPFAMAQCRVECRSGLRPRGFLRGGVIDNALAGAQLAARWGYAFDTGEVKLSRGYDEIGAVVTLAGSTIFAAGLRDPAPLRGSDVYYVANMNLAQTPRGLRLVQVDPEFAIERAERGQPLLRHFDAEAWRCSGVRPSSPISASFTVAEVTLPSLRYVCRPDVLAFEGTERVDT